MTSLREESAKRFAKVVRTKNFSLAEEASGRFVKQNNKRPVYKAVLDAKGHVRFSNNNTRVIVKNANDGKEYNMPIMAINRYCDFVATGKLSGITAEEKESATVLAKAIKAKLQSSPTFSR